MRKRRLVFWSLVMLLLPLAPGFAFDVEMKVYNRWNADGTNTREVDFLIENFGGTMTDDPATSQIVNIEIAFDADPPGTGCPPFSFDPAPGYEGGGNFWFHEKDISCFSRPLTAGARGDGEYQATVFTGNGNSEVQDPPVPAVSRVSQWRELTSATLMSPADGAVLETNRPSLEWDPAVNLSDGAVLYHRVVIDHPVSGERVYSGPTPYASGLTHLTVPWGILQPGEIYRWQVRAYDGDSWSSGDNYSRSERWYFTAGEPQKTSVPAFDRWGGILLFAGIVAAGWVVVRKKRIS